MNRKDTIDKITLRLLLLRGIILAEHPHKRGKVRRDFMIYVVMMV